MDLEPHRDLHLAEAAPDRVDPGFSVFNPEHVIMDLDKKLITVYGLRSSRSCNRCLTIYTMTSGSEPVHSQLHDLPLALTRPARAVRESDMYLYNKVRLDPYEYSWPPEKFIGEKMEKEGDKPIPSHS